MFEEKGFIAEKDKKCRRVFLKLSMTSLVPYF